MKVRNQTKFKETEIGPIPEEWNLLPFTEAVDFNPKRKIENGSEVKFVAMTDIKIFDKKISSYSLRKFTGGSKFKNGDTLMARITPCLENGKTSFVDFLGEDEVAGGSTEFIVLSGKERMSDSSFVYYLTTSEKIRSVAIKAMTGTSGRQRVENDKFGSHLVSLPTIKEQKQIAEILSSLDDKIELNRKINENLEKLASSLFKQWFIDFDSELADGWRVTTLGEFVPIKTGKKDANVATVDGQYPFFTCSQDVLKTNLYSFDASALLLAGNGDFSIKWYEGKFEAYQRTYVLIPHKKELLGFLYYLVKYFLDDITAGHRGSVIKFITKGMIESFEIKIPSDNLLEEKAKIFYEINQLIDFYKREIDNFSQIRDSLLPRLMSGKIRVK